MNIKADPMQILKKIPFMDRLSQSAHVFPLPGGLVMDLSYLQAGAMIFFKSFVLFFSSFDFSFDINFGTVSKTCC